MTEPVSELDNLAAQGAQLDQQQNDAAQPGQGNSPQEDQPPKLTNAQIIAGALAMGREVFCKATELQSPKVHLRDEVVAELGGVWGPVCDKHGWNLNEHMGAWQLEITAVLTTGMIALSVYKAVQEEIRARNAKPVEPEPEAVAAGA